MRSTGQLLTVVTMSLLALAGCGGESTNGAGGASSTSSSAAGGLSQADAKSKCDKLQAALGTCIGDAEVKKCEACYEKCADCAKAATCPATFSCP